MEPQPSLAPTPTAYRSITQAAVALALGGRFVRQFVDRSVLMFEVVPPEGLDFNDPNLTAPVSPLLAWTEALATRVREHTRQRREPGTAR
jgi:hypothetical protein